MNVARPDYIDAMRVYVRGFWDVPTGIKIVEQLQQMGFEIDSQFDGTSDSQGGLIETTIADVNQLESNDPDVIKEKVYACVPDCFATRLEWQFFQEGANVTKLSVVRSGIAMVKELQEKLGDFATLADAVSLLDNLLDKKDDKSNDDDDE